MTTASGSASIVSERLDDLIVARLATLRHPPTGTQLAKALRVFAPSNLDDARWAASVEASLARLAESGALGADHAVDGGPAVAARRFAVSGAFTWKRATDRLLPALALGVEARDQARLDGRDDWAAATAARALGLWTSGPPPRLGAVCDALVWRELALAGKPKRTPPEVRAHFVRTLVAAGPSTPERLVHLLAAREAGAPRADLRALREALVRRWLCGQAWGGAPPPSLEELARAARAAAARVTDGRFGDRKVFVAAAWRALRERPEYAVLSLPDFKLQLVEAHKAGLVVLVRADLTAAMDEASVRESEIVHLEARYHFIETGSAS